MYSTAQVPQVLPYQRKPCGEPTLSAALLPEEQNVSKVDSQGKSAASTADSCMGTGGVASLRNVVVLTFPREYSTSLGATCGAPHHPMSQLIVTSADS